MELVSNCMQRLTFCKLVFKSQTKYQEIIDILQSKRIPLYFKSHFYRYLFDAYISTGNFKFKKIFHLISKVILPEMEIIVRFCNFKNNFGLRRNNSVDLIYGVIHKKIQKRDNQFEEDEEEDEEPYQMNNSLEMMQSEEEEAEISLAEEEITDDELDNNNHNQSIIEHMSKDYSVIDSETGNLNTLWFGDHELVTFINEKQKNLQFDGFITFLADLTSYMMYFMKKNYKIFRRASSIIDSFAEMISSFEKCLKQFKAQIEQEDFSHILLLMEMIMQNISIMREEFSTDNIDRSRDTFMVNFATENSRSKQDYGLSYFQGPTKKVLQQRMKADLEMNVIMEDGNEGDEEGWEGDDVIDTQGIILTALEKKSNQIFNLVRYSLMVLKLSFSEYLKDLFDGELTDMEKSLSLSLVHLIERAQSTKYNYFITLEKNIRMDVEYQDIERCLRYIKFKMNKDSDPDLEDNINEELDSVLDDDEVISIIIKLNSILYFTIPDFQVGKDPLDSLMRMDSFNQVEKTNYLDSIEMQQIKKAQDLKRFLANQNFYNVFLNLVEFNFLAIQKDLFEHNGYMTILQEVYFGFDLELFREVFFNQKIEKSLSRYESRFLYIHALKKTIQNHYIAGDETKERAVFIKENQNALSGKFVGLFVLRLLVSEKESDIVRSECLTILYLMLVNGNENVQRHLFMAIINNYEIMNLVEVIEGVLKTFYNQILNDIREIETNYKLKDGGDTEYQVLKRYLGLDFYKSLTNVLMFLQILNENCFKPFQDMFREQHFSDQNSSNNVIQLIIDIMISLGEYIIIGSKPHLRVSSVSETETASISHDTGSLRDITNKSLLVKKHQKKKKKIYRSKGYEKMMTKNFNEDLGQARRKTSSNKVIMITELENAKLKSLIHYGLFFLNDCMMGPQDQNQLIIVSNPGLIEFIYTIIEKMTFPKLRNLGEIRRLQFDYHDYILFTDAVKMLLFSTNGKLVLENYKYIFNENHIQLLEMKTRDIYNCIVRHNRQRLYSNTFCKASSEDSSLFFLKMNDVNLTEISGLARNELQNNEIETLIYLSDDDPIADRRTKKNIIRQMLYKITEAGHDIFIVLKRHQSLMKIKRKRKEEYYQFFRRYFGYVEIKNETSISISQFTKPYPTFFHHDKQILQTHFSIEPHNEKINNFINRIEMYEEVLDRRMSRYRFSRPLYYVAKNKQWVEYIYYIILLIINFIIIIKAKHQYDGDLNIINVDLRNGLDFFEDNLEFSVNYMRMLGVASTFLAVIIFFLNIMEHIPPTKFFWANIHGEISEELDAIKKKSIGVRKTYLQIIQFITDTSKTGIGYWFSFANVYNLCIVGLSMTAIFIPFFYPFLLLDLIQRSLTLRNIVSSVTKNWQQLLLTLVITLIVMFCYAAISFTFFPDHYEHTDDSEFKNYCHTLSHCFYSVLNNGLRAGGGLGEALGQPTIEDSRYYIRYWVDLTFMIIILIILLNIVFGIIIDTFGDMRNARDEWNNYIINTCLICNMSKSEIDSGGEGYYQHVNISHSIDDYVHYIIYIKNKNMNDCDGIEQMVKAKYEAKDYSFLPNQESFHSQNKT